MDATSTAPSLDTLLVLATTAFYAGVYYAARHITARVSPGGEDSSRPRWVGLAAMLVVAAATTAWMRATFIDPRVYASLDPFSQGQYAGRASGPAVVPAVFASIVILVKIWRTRRKRLARERDRPKA